MKKNPTGDRFLPLQKGTWMQGNAGEKKTAFAFYGFGIWCCGIILGIYWCEFAAHVFSLVGTMVLWITFWGFCPPVLWDKPLVIVTNSDAWWVREGGKVQFKQYKE